AWIGDVRAGSATSCGNHIKSSCRLIAFNADGAGGGVLGIVTLQSEERQAVTSLPCHAADLVTDFDFSPFDDFLLATCSADETVKLWRLSAGGQNLSCSPGVTLGPEGCCIEVVQFHPAADGVLATGAGKTAKIWDVARQKAFAG
uniref:Coronin-7 n=1 Tax=Latimeria chalumnae TaxID=7897 RepID=H3A1J1_LATCH